MEEKQFSDFTKGRIVGLDEAGIPQRRIAEKIGCNVSNISRFLKKYKETCFWGRKKGSGRKRALTDRDDSHIRLIAKRKRLTTAKEIKSALSLDVSCQTIRNRFHEIGFSSHFQVKKPFVSPKNRKKRLKWAKEHRSWTIATWRNVLWSDESPYVLRFSQKRRVWRLPNERYASYCLKGTVKHDKKINVWGCFCASGIGKLYRVKANLEQKQYKQIMIHQMIPSGKKLFSGDHFLFQQDNDPKHTAKTVQKYLASKTTLFTVLDWPSQSPDLNPIENLWCLLDKKVKDRDCKNENELFEVLKKGWEDLSVDVLGSLVESMPRKCQAVIDSKGFPTKY